MCNEMLWEVKMNSIGKVLGIVFLAGAVVQIAPAQPVIFTALKSASSSALLSPGSWVSIYGVNFAAATQTAQSTSLPTTLGGVSVTVGGLSASLRYVSIDNVLGTYQALTAVQNRRNRL
jgi:hypothetical protein